MSDKNISVSFLFVYHEYSEDTEKLMKTSLESFFNEIGTSLDTESVSIARTSKGKPYIVGLDNVHLSVTHSGAYCVVSVAFCETGVDLQQHERLKTETAEQASERYLKLSKRFFHNDEYEYVKKDPLIRFFDVWTAKESYVKLTGDGIDDSFWSYSILDENASESLSSWKKRNVFFRIVPFLPDYTLCVCLSEPTTVKLIYK